MLVRKAQIEDLESLAKLFDAYRVFYRKESDLEAASAFLLERIETNSSVIFVVEENEELSAFTQLYPLFSSTQMKRLWLLNDLFVDKKSRGKGQSKLLMERVKTFCFESDAAGFYLETEKSNSVGTSLYKRVGMDLDETHHFFHWTVNK